jgi:EAL domain-containing protein (putative c-di-GMP-specific phosphodiesterase class I)
MSVESIGPPEDSHLDLATGLPRLSAALTEIARQMQEVSPERCIGIIDFLVLPEPALYRLAPEADHGLRSDITARLSAMLRPQDKLYVLDHWEWLVVAADLPSSAPLLLAMMKFAALFDSPLQANDDSLLMLRVACGGALYPDNGEDPRHLVQSSRIACLAAVRSDSGHALYDPAMEQVDKSQHLLHAEMPRALAGYPGLALHLQPQVDLRSGACVGCEALLRWTLPNGEAIPPHRALATVERLGLHGKFTRWLLQQAIQIQNRLQAEQIEIILSVNLSAHDLLDTELPDLLAQTLATWDIAPGCLLLELTETQVIEDTAQVIDVLRRLRTLGFQLSVDDFGTGYASMSYLRRLPVQEVKIDQSFVRHAESSEHDREIIASVVQLAHRLGMVVVAEGVETEAAAEIVTRLDCDRAQGYLYAAAMPLDDFIGWWRARAER